jgi:PAS domain S-box-containing protein
VYGVAADITARKQAEKRLADSEAQMRLLTDALPVGILRCGADLRYRFVNPVYAEQFMQLQPQQLVGRFMSEMLDHEVYAATRPYLDQVLAGCMVEYEMPVVLPRGHRHIHVSYVPEFKGSEVEGFVGVVTDITERVEAQIERDRLHALEHQARRQAEAATKARDEFLAIVSHELRSPLNGIQSWAHVLESVLRSELPTVQRALAGIRTGVEQQVRLIDDLLDATRIMSGKLSLIKQNVNLRPVVEAALASVRASAQAKQVALIADYRADEGQLDGDPDRLQQIVWNLLSNAIKFVPSRGHVWLSAWSEGGEALIQVRDDGKGIDPAFVPHLFDWFSRDETSSHRGQDGLGLGLALVRHLCELHDGSVAAESPGPGRGATFTVRLPLRRAPRVLYSAPAPGHSDTPLPSLEGVRVMLVDDQRETRESVSTLLTQAGAEVTVFASGEEAVARLEQEPERRPQVLVCDIAMPGQDGYATLARIRVRENAAGVPRAERVRAAALTAFAQREDRIRALSAGFESYITKPVSLDELIIVVAALAGRGLESAGRSWPPLW